MTLAGLLVAPVRVWGALVFGIGILSASLVLELGQRRRWPGALGGLTGRVDVSDEGTGSGRTVPEPGDDQAPAAAACPAHASASNGRADGSRSDPTRAAPP